MSIGIFILKAKARLLLLENTWADGHHDDEAGDYQSQSRERNQEDTPSAGREFAANDPVLDLKSALLCFEIPARLVLDMYLAFKVSPTSCQEYHDSNP